MSEGTLPAVGDVLAGRTIVRPVGEGAMGIVYEARGISDRSVAIKVLKPAPAADPTLVQEFAAEGQSTGAVRHENVVQILEQGTEDGLHYMIMEFVDGPPLDRLLRTRKRLDWKLATKLLLPVAKALGHAHAQGLIHRDVKPGNILLYRDGRPRLTDFGIVKDIGSLKGYLVQGRAVGTPAYASPEQCTGKRLSEGTDMYSLGATFYHALTGRPPFTGDTAVKLAKQHVNVPPAPPNSLVKDTPRALSKIVEKMLAKRVSDRVVSMERLVHDLEMIQQGKVALDVGPGRPKVNTAALKGLRRTRTVRRIG